MMESGEIIVRTCVLLVVILAFWGISSMEEDNY
jgi:hypothetical protein